MSKCYQYVTNDLKVCSGMREVSIKVDLFSLQKIITWTKKSGKGKQEWFKFIKIPSITLENKKTLVKTQFDSKVILFKETLEFKDAINLCYSKQTIALQNKIPIP
jgi:hypothetical protein